MSIFSIWIFYAVHALHLLLCRHFLLLLIYANRMYWYSLHRGSGGAQHSLNWALCFYIVLISVCLSQCLSVLISVLCQHRPRWPKASRAGHRPVQTGVFLCRHGLAVSRSSSFLWNNGVVSTSRVDKCYANTAVWASNDSGWSQLCSVMLVTLVCVSVQHRWWARMIDRWQVMD